MQRRFNCFSQLQFHVLRSDIQITQLWRQVETFLDEQVLNRILQCALPFDDESFKVVLAKRTAQQNVESRRRDKMRLKHTTNGRLSALLDELRQIGVRKPVPDNVAIRFRRKGRAVEDGIDETARDMLLAPRIGDDVVIVEVPVLRNIARHPVSRSLEDKQVEDAVID